jgi:predicted HAD superfamily Cof-like phosphohydrolase
MKKQIEAVREFHETFKQENGVKPRLLNDKEYELRYNLMAEENKEYFMACESQDLTEIADALGDKLYILCGTILKHGMQDIIEKVFDEIHASNMSKVGEDGKAIMREDGKILKGPNYFRPNLKQFIENAENK